MANEFRVKNGLIVSNGDITHEDGNFSYTSASELLEVTYLKANVIIEVQNASSTDVLYKGTPVYISAIGTGKPQVSKAEADDSTKMPSIGIVVANISASGSGYITTGGTLNGLDGDADSANPIVDVDVTTGDIGKVLYVSETAGLLTLTRPTAAASLVQNVGVISDVTGSAGSVNFKMKVSNIGRANDTPNKISIEGDIYTQGNIGIGTTSPASPLHVGSTAYELSSGAYLISSQQRTAKMVIHADDANTNWYSQEIGLALHNEDPTNNNWSPHIAFTTHEDDDGDPANANPVAVAAISATYNTRVANGWAKGDLAFFTNNAGTGNAERMRITGAGKVGINNDSPTATLDVTIAGSNTTTSGIAFGDSAGKGYLAAGSSYISFATDDGTTRLAIDNGGTNLGNVGIGTTSPDSLLHVRGAVPILTVQDNSNGITALSSSMAGIDLISDGMNAGASKYGTALKFLSTDGQFTTENPKFLAAIVPRATETYSADTDGGMALDFAVTDDDPGATNVPSVAMTIDHTGNVGIGTTSPSFASGGGLEIEHADQANLRVTDSTASASSDFGQSENDLYIVNRKTNGDIKIRVNSSNELMTFDGQNQRVGIGTTSPGDLLELEAENAVIRLDASDSGGVAWVKFDDQGTSKWALGISKNGLSGADFHIYEDASSGSPRFTVKDGGNVGIGTSSPEYDLDVDGTIRILPTISSNAGTAIRIGAGGDSNDITLIRIDGSTAQNQGETDSAQAGLSMKYMGSGTGNNNRFALVMDNQQGTPVEGLSVLQDGKVGIGETSPTFPLHVKYTDNRTDPEGSGASSGAGAIGADAEGGGLYIENLSTTDGSWSGITFRTDTADARIAYQSVGSSLINEGQMSFFLDANDTGGDQLTLEEVLRLRGGGSGASQTFNSVDLPTNDARLRLGASQQLELKFDGSHTRITHDAATDSWMIFKNEDGAGFQFNIGTDKGVEINKDGNVELYYDNSKKIETTSAGATVTGTLTTTDLTVTGDLTVSGTTTTLNTQTVEVEDNIIQLNTTQGSPDTATANVSGIEIYRGDGVNAASFKFDDGNSDRWRLYNGTGSMDFYMTGAVSEMSAESNHLYLTTKRDQDSIYLRTGTTETTRLYIDGGQNYSGYVGIGTTTPGHNLEVNGSFAATTKSFDIKHPTKEGMRLHHGSLEGPEHGVYHRGVGTSNVVELPDYWTGLVDEDTITVQLTPRGSFQQLFVSKVEGNRVHVDSTGDGDLSFYYNIYGTRKDVGKMEVEY